MPCPSSQDECLNSLINIPLWTIKNKYCDAYFGRIQSQIISNPFNTLQQIIYTEWGLAIRNIQKAIRACRHQNIIGWSNFIRSFISSYWIASQSNHRGDGSWPIKLTRLSLTLFKTIWDDHSKEIQCNTSNEARKKGWWKSLTLLPRYTKILPN
jgi:hypothetical protein